MADIAPPIIDFSAFRSKDPKEKASLVQQVRSACLDKGFFQITNHGIPVELQDEVFKNSKWFFDLPQKEKNKCDKDSNTWNRGYERIKSQMLEAGTLPELKEGYYIGRELSKEHPLFVRKRVNCGPNVWPKEDVEGAEDFRKTCTEYYDRLYSLANDVFEVLALSLNIPENWFKDYSNDAIAIMRLLYYPPQAPGSANERGIGAHTDFGALTLLMQDDVGGLQVLDGPTNTWIDVKPIPHAYVVNLGDLTQRWTNGTYHSNLHRVINLSGRERYSVAFFFNGNPDYVVDCIPGCETNRTEKYSPISVHDYISQSYNLSYMRAKAFKTAV